MTHLYYLEQVDKYIPLHEKDFSRHASFQKFPLFNAILVGG